MINKYHNPQYNGGSPNLPEAVGDRYYGQDLMRDFQFLRDQVGLALKDMIQDIPNLMQGGGVSQGTGDTLNITAGVGYAKFQVTVPDDFGAAQPPTVLTPDIEAIRIAWTVQTNLVISSATLDGATTNYVKVAYAETDLNTRARAKSTGSYAYELSPGFTITVNSTPNTDYEILLATFVGSAGGSFTFTTASYNKAVSIPVGSIIAWLPGFFTDGSNGSYTAVAGVTLPDNFKECDGSVLNDSESSIYHRAGRYLPNLTDDRLLMGDISGSAGSVGGTNDGHYHGMGAGATLNITSSGSHRHFTMYNNSGGGSNAITTSNCPDEVSVLGSDLSYSLRADSSTRVPDISRTNNSLHTHIAGDFSGLIGLVTGGVDGNAAGSNIPLYLSVRYIQKIK